MGGLAQGNESERLHFVAYSLRARSIGILICILINFYDIQLLPCNHIRSYLGRLVLRHTCSYLFNISEDVDFIKDLLLHRWNFMHTESMGMAYILNPANIGNRMVGRDYRDSVVHLKTHIDRIYSEPEEAEKCKAEFVEFISFFRSCSEAEKDALVGSKAKEYWAVYGCNDYPLLGKIAIQLYHVPTLSASSERVWSIFGFVHSLKRNRLKNKKVERLVFICCNAALLDAVDILDYLKFNNLEDLDDSNDSTEGV